MGGQTTSVCPFSLYPRNKKRSGHYGQHARQQSITRDRIAHLLHRHQLHCTTSNFARKHHTKKPRIPNTTFVYFVKYCYRFDRIKILFRHILLVRKMGNLVLISFSWSSTSKTSGNQNSSWKKLKHISWTVEVSSQKHQWFSTIFVQLIVGRTIFNIWNWLTTSYKWDFNGGRGRHREVTVGL